MGDQSWALDGELNIIMSRVYSRSPNRGGAGAADNFGWLLGSFSGGPYLQQKATLDGHSHFPLVPESACLVANNMTGQGGGYK
jgi:hypothetical protein